MKNILIIPNMSKDADYRFTKMIIEKLADKPVKLFLKEHHSNGFGDGIAYLAGEEELRSIDLIIVLGGDGSMLDAARYAAGSGIPLLGVNLGRLGYMENLEIGELDLLDRLYSGDYSIEERIMLTAEVVRNGKTRIKTAPALNEIVLTRGTLSRMIDVSFTCNGSAEVSYRADGLIFATPTGSTAYSMSAGGPVIDPELGAIAVTPVCPHSLNSRPMVFGVNAEFSVYRGGNSNERWYLTVDGRDSFPLGRHDTIKIAKSQYTTRLLNLKKSSFYDVLHRKMSDMQ